MDEEQTQGETRAQQIARSLGMAVGSPARVEAAPVVESGDDMADLFEVPQPTDNDIACDDLLELDEEEGVEDLLTVSHEDIVNGNDKPKPKPQLVRTNKPYPPMLTGMR